MYMIVAYYVLANKPVIKKAWLKGVNTKLAMQDPYNSYTRSLQRQYIILHAIDHYYCTRITAALPSAHLLAMMMMTAIAKENDFYHSHSRQENHPHVVADMVSQVSLLVTDLLL